MTDHTDQYDERAAEEARETAEVESYERTPAGQLVQQHGGIDDAAAAFHAANPRVYERLVALARQWRAARPGKKLGIAVLWERLRWEVNVATVGEPLKLNNNYRAWYARQIMALEPDLRGLFRTRHRESDD